MKYTYQVLMLLVGILLMQCAVHKKVLYEIPANYPEGRRVQLAEICEKGQELFKIHCAGCHGIFTKGKKDIPNFTSTQLDNYSSRFILRDQKNHALAMQMSPEQLNQVITFLRYKKSNGKDTVSTANH